MLTDLADVVLRTMDERDAIANMVLAKRSVYIAFVASEAEMNRVHRKVNSACIEALGKGNSLFPDTAPIIVGTDTLRTHVPTRNVRFSTNKETAALVESDETGGVAEHHLAVAAKRLLT